MKLLRRFSATLVASVVLFEAAALPVHAKRRDLTRYDVVPNEDKLELAFPGVEGAIPYDQYGDFTKTGTEKYRYVVKEKAKLRKAAGEGIFPNQDYLKDPVYRKLRKDGELDGSHWDFVENNTPAKNFYKWISTNEDPGVRQFFLALMLERSGLIEESIKAFYALAVHFPKSIGWTYYKTPWYMGPVALDRAEQLLRRHTDIKMAMEGGRIEIRQTFDRSTRNDIIKTDPGVLKNVKRRKKPKREKLKKPVQVIGGPKVQLKKYKNGHWQLLVDKKPFEVKAITYSVAPVGTSPDFGTYNPSKDWQLWDQNNNGLHDSFFESFVDKNNNNQQDKDEPTVGDAKLLKDMGINTLRTYHHIYNKPLFKKLYEDYGLYLICGDLLGGYAVGSGATWAEGTDYRDPAQRKNMLDSVRKMVEENKDEPYILMWALGNENAYGVANNSGEHPEVYYEFVNEAAQLIHELDPSRPVVHVNGDLIYLDIYAAKCPNVDIFGANVYRGEQGFGRHLFKTVKEMTGQPVLITEYGCSAYADGYPQEVVEAFQAMYMANNWEDLEAHMAGYGEGNALGGVMFEWVDEWWKTNHDLPDYVKKERPEWYAERADRYANRSPNSHETVPAFGLPFLDGWSYEEWLGFVGLGNGENSLFVRQLRPVYHVMKEMLNK